MGKEGNRSDRAFETAADAGADHQEVAAGRQAVGGGAGGRLGREAVGGVGADAASVAAAVRGSEGPGCEAAEGAGTRERDLRIPVSIL